jgi:hypothetical protein
MIDRANPRGKFPESLDELLVLTGWQAFRLMYQKPKF